MKDKIRRVRRELRNYAGILDRLKKADVISTQNSPVGDVAEWLARQVLHLKGTSNSTKSYDATDRNNVRYQIKGRRVTSSNKSMQLSAIRFPKNRKPDFRWLIVVAWDEAFKLIGVWKADSKIIKTYGKYRDYTNSWVLTFGKSVQEDENVEDLTETFRQYWG